MPEILSSLHRCHSIKELTTVDITNENHSNTSYNQCFHKKTQKGKPNGTVGATTSALGALSGFVGVERGDADTVSYSSSAPLFFWMIKKQ
jgi:hypothetical protein